MGSKLVINKDDYFPHQWKFLTTNKPISGLISGFGSGKTYIFIRRVFIAHITKKNKQGVSNGWVVYPTYDLADELFVEPFKDLLQDKGIPFDYNISKHRFRTPYGTIKIYQLQKPQRIIGAELTYIGFDEFDVESYKNCDIAFKKAIGRMRGTDNSQIFIVSTPEGFHYCHKIFVEDAGDDRVLINGKTTDNKYLPDSYLNLMRNTYDEKLLEAYMNGRFTNLQHGSTYYAFKREEHTGRVSYNPRLPIRIGMDWNVDPLCAVIFQVYRNEKPNIRVVREISLHHAGEGDLMTQRMCDTIREMYPNNVYIAYPDATGSARASSAQYSDISIVRRNGFKVNVAHINPKVVNRVNAMNKQLSNNNILIDASCKDLIGDLEKVTNKEGTREIDKSNKKLSHMTDAFGYGVNWEYPVVRPVIGTADR
tara:strand:- start:732 stop:2000 length:1269 start_codon:yes stop_codon:yes gene_type:complete